LREEMGFSDPPLVALSRGMTAIEVVASASSLAERISAKEDGVRSDVGLIVGDKDLLLAVIDGDGVEVWVGLGVEVGLGVGVEVGLTVGDGVGDGVVGL
jgi:hypothetical protein